MRISDWSSDVCSSDRTAILLAAGEGSRLRSVSHSKPLCIVDGKPLIDHALERLARAGLRRAIVVTGYLAGEVESHLAMGRYAIEIGRASCRESVCQYG